MRIANLSTKSGSMSSSDKFVTDNGTTVTKIDYNALAKAIIEQYTGSTLAGSAQSVKAALDALNSKIGSSFYTSYAVLSDADKLSINFDDSNGGVFLLLCVDRRSSATPKACMFQKYRGTTNKYALTGGDNWASASTSTGMRVTLENTYFTVLAIGNVPFAMSVAS